jgi:hypothetical protein
MKYQNVNFALQERNWIVPMLRKPANAQIPAFENFFKNLISRYIYQNRGVEERIPLKQGLKQNCLSECPPQSLTINTRFDV